MLEHQRNVIDFLARSILPSHIYNVDQSRTIGSYNVTLPIRQINSDSGVTTCIFGSSNYITCSLMVLWILWMPIASNEGSVLIEQQDNSFFNCYCSFEVKPSISLWTAFDIIWISDSQGGGCWLSFNFIDLIVSMLITSYVCHPVNLIFCQSCHLCKVCGKYDSQAGSFIPHFVQ